MAEISLKLRIYGRVQGVSYRDWTVKAATKQGLDGWVRNREDGTVEAVVCGPETDVRAFIEKCRKGPWLAKVDKIEEELAQETVPHGRFERKPTA